MHPYGDPITKDIIYLGKKFNYKDNTPLVIGEICYSNTDKWKDDAYNLYNNRFYAWNKYSKVSSYFNRSCKSAFKLGARGSVPHTLLAFGYWGPVSLDSFVTGPFNFNGIFDLYRHVYWPSLSGKEPKVDNIYLWTWHSSQFNWFDSNKPLYTGNIIHRTIRRTYEEITGEDLPRINSVASRNLIVYILHECAGYVYLQYITENNSKVVGFLPDSRYSAWFIINKAGKYRVWYYTKGGEMIEDKITVERNYQMVKPGFNPIEIKL